MSYENTIRLWNASIVTFWALAFAVVFLPLESIFQSFGAAHLALEIAFIGIGVTVLIFPVVDLFSEGMEAKYHHHFTLHSIPCSV